MNGLISPTNPNTLEPSWQRALGNILAHDTMQALRVFLRQQKQAKKIIYPAMPDVFKAFAQTPLDKVKVVILGQDPYHGKNQAHGLSFSVPLGIPIPPSLMNIYKELHSDLGIAPAQHGCLLAWAKQGVLLLNSVLTVEQGLPGSHQGKGWEFFTDSVVKVLNQQSRPLVFVLWGAYAQKKGRVIDSSKHLVIRTPHPSPLSVYRGFFGSRPFSRINTFLVHHQQTKIDWDLNAKSALNKEH
jgi:uracil-DNA glycosylase